jgi:hypothetical protein
VKTRTGTLPEDRRPGDGRPRRRYDGRTPEPWTVRTAHVLALIALPSGLWRIGIALGFSMGIENAGVTPPPGQALAILGLSVISEAVALLSLGLVRPWGEVAPRWIPLLGGHRLPPALVTTTAVTGALALMAIWTFATANFATRTLSGAVSQGFVFTNTWWEALLITCYAPLLAWGPLLLILATAYHRRRTGH